MRVTYSLKKYNVHVHAYEIMHVQRLYRVHEIHVHVGQDTIIGKINMVLKYANCPKYSH